MPRKEYITWEARQKFDHPPILNPEQKLIFLKAPEWATEYVRTLQTPSNKVGFLLQVGYFRIVSRFFVSSRYHQSDVDFVAERISIDVNAVQMSDYEGRTALRHREDILGYFGFAPFEKSSGQALIEETQRLAHVQTRPYLIFEGMVAFLQEHHIEIPTYQTLKTILDKALSIFERDLESILTRYLTSEDILLLDQLLVEHSSYQEDARRHLKVKRYEITFFKRISQSMETKQIRERVQSFQHLKRMYLQLLPVAKRLKLSDATIQFYAEYVINNQVPRIATRSTIRYLLLIAFIIHQYYLLGDALILTLNGAVTNYVNGCENMVKQELYGNQMQTAQLVSSVTHRSITHVSVLAAIEKIIVDTAMESLAKVTLIEQLFKNKRLSQKLLQEDGRRLKDLREANQRINDREDYYMRIEKNSFKLSGKVSGIVKALVACSASSGKDILKAFLYFQDKDGSIGSRGAVPTDFLGMEEQQRVLTHEGKLRVGLYKVFLFEQIRDNIKSGALPIDSSYDYRSFEEYEIPGNVWHKEKDRLIEQARLTAYRNPRVTLLDLNEKLNAQIRKTNERIEAGENKKVYFDAGGDWHLMKDKGEADTPESESLYPQEYIIPLLEVLTTIQNATGFTSAFRHAGIDYIPKRPEEKLFFAAILGYGCNIGIRKFSFMSKGIRTSSLETTALHYFSPDILIQANDKVLAFRNALPLTEHFRKDPGLIHTSSDGQNGGARAL